MTLPASGAISIANVNNEVGLPTTYSTSLSWISGNTKGGYTNMNSLHGLAWYQKNNSGACNNGNCTNNNCACNCNGDCFDCFISGRADCVNCDGRAYLQANCNCDCACGPACTCHDYNCNCGDCLDGSYVCTTGSWSYSNNC